MTKRVRVTDEQAFLDKLDENYDQIKSSFLEGPYISKNMCESIFHINITTPPKFNWYFKDDRAYAFVVIWVRSYEMKWVTTVNDTSTIATEMMLPRNDMFALSFSAVNTPPGIQVSLNSILSNNNDVKKLLVQALGISRMYLSNDYYTTKLENSILIK